MLSRFHAYSFNTLTVSDDSFANCSGIVVGALRSEIGILSNRTPPPRGRGELIEFKSLSPNNVGDHILF